MKILLTGILPPLALGTAGRLIRDGHQVTVLGRVDGTAGRPRGAAVHDIHPGHPDALRLMEACRFQAVVFFYAYQCEELEEYGSVQGAMLDALFSMQHTAQQNGAERFVLVTDRRVFGRAQAGREDETPIPDSPTGILIKAAEDCLRCGAQEGVSTLLLRVSSLYAPGEAGTFFAEAQNCAREDRDLVLKGAADTPCDFLHADDLALFLSLALDKGLSGVAHACYGVARTYGQMAAALLEKLPGLRVSFAPARAREAVLQLGAAQALNWVPRHDCLKELDELVGGAEKARRGGRLKARLATAMKRSLGKALPWVELILLALAAQGLLQLTATNATFRFVDFWLLYVILMGNMHGGPMGVLAALIACLAYALDWLKGGNDVSLLVFNIDNWLPVVTYLLAGGFFGYLHDKQQEKLDAMRLEQREREDEARFLQTMYHQAYEDRNQLQEQVMRYRDSYGRIYSITRELDTLQPEQIFLSTLDVLEDTMQNHSVALYSRKGNTAFARLVVHSRAIDHLARSLDMETLPLMKEKLDQGQFFANATLEPGYPAFAAPVMNGEEPVAAIMLWDVPFDHQTLYHQNLFSVVAGLVQSAMLRALQYLSAAHDMYLEDTHILASQAFRSTLGIYQNMRKRRTGSFLLLRVRASEALPLSEYDKRIGRATRSTDLAGRLEDGEYYVLFPQAGVENAPQIGARFAAQGLSYEVVSQEVAYA